MLLLLLTHSQLLPHSQLLQMLLLLKAVALRAAGCWIMEQQQQQRAMAAPVGPGAAGSWLLARVSLQALPATPWMQHWSTTPAVQQLLPALLLQLLQPLQLLVSYSQAAQQQVQHQAVTWPCTVHLAACCLLCSTTCLTL